MNTAISSKVNVWLRDALDAQLPSADAKRERGRLVRAVLVLPEERLDSVSIGEGMAGVGGRNGE